MNQIQSGNKQGGRLKIPIRLQLQDEPCRCILFRLKTATIPAAICNKTNS